MERKVILFSQNIMRLANRIMHLLQLLASTWLYKHHPYENFTESSIAVRWHGMVWYGIFSCKRVKAVIAVHLIIILLKF